MGALEYAQCRVRFRTPGPPIPNIESAGCPTHSGREQNQSQRRTPREIWRALRRPPAIAQSDAASGRTPQTLFNRRARVGLFRQSRIYSYAPINDEQGTIFWICYSTSDKGQTTHKWQKPIQPDRPPSRKPLGARSIFHRINVRVYLSRLPTARRCAIMSLILLTGAGFSRNWGGWLATEAFEYLIGQDDL